MFNLFSKKYVNGVLVVSEREFWKRLESESTPVGFFDEQGDAHGDIDLRLVDKIDEYLTPLIGSWESSDNWYHNIDFYGDGVRSLSFSRSLFKPEYINVFQKMLEGEHEPFCILCQVHESMLSNEESKIGSIAIFSNKLMVTKGLATMLTLVT